MAKDDLPIKANDGFAAFVSLIRDLAGFAGVRGALALLYILLGAVFESIGLVLIIPLLGLVMGSKAAGGMLQRVSAETFAVFGVTSSVGRLALLMAGFAILMALRAVVISARDNTTQGLQIDYVEDLRGRVAGSLAAAGWDRVLRLRHARVLSILSNDIQRIGTAAHYLLQACIALVILTVQCILSFILSPGLSLFAFALLIGGAIAMVPVLRRSRALGSFIMFANQSLLETATQFLSGLKFALSQDLQGGFVAEYQETSRGLKERQQTYYRQQTRGRVWLSTVTALVGAAVVLAGFGAFHLPPAVLIAFLLVIARMSGPAMQVQQGFQLLAHGLPSFESIMRLLDDLKRAAPARNSVARAVPEGPIVFEAVTFQHADGADSQGVRAVNLRLLPGTFVGIAGTSGAGKTTFADLLVGLLLPQSGRILVGGATLDETILASWRSQLSYISQDPFLFHDTVRRNLRWVRPEASEEEMWEALALAGADGIVRRMEGGLDAMVGERGSLVSGGERQRIALARGLLRKPKLLVMDEATNAIDIDGERTLLERLLALRPRLTIVMIAHRIESIALCERVLKMENGTLVDDSAPALRVQPAG